MWTDVGRNGGGSPRDADLINNVVFEAFDAAGDRIVNLGPFSVGDAVINRTTDEDRFFGVISPEGIASIRLSMPGLTNWEADHLQYGRINSLGGSPNVAPVAADDTFATDEDTALSGHVTINDTDVDGDTLTVELSSDVANGILSLASDGSFTYTPDANFSGNDTFTYSISDGNGGIDSATITVNVTNDALYGDEGSDRLWGDDGDDILRGGLGNDILTGDDFSGGTGDDVFVLALGAGTDIITDFGNGNDKIGLAEGLTFADLAITGAGDNMLIQYLETILAFLRPTHSCLGEEHE